MMSLYILTNLIAIAEKKNRIAQILQMVAKMKFLTLKQMVAETRVIPVRETKANQITQIEESLNRMTLRNVQVTQDYLMDLINIMTPKSRIARALAKKLGIPVTEIPMSQTSPKDLIVKKLTKEMK